MLFITCCCYGCHCMIIIIVGIPTASNADAVAAGAADAAPPPTLS